MNREALKTLLQFGIFITGTSVLLLFFIPRESPTFVVNLMSICVGVMLLGLATYLIRRG